MCMTSSKSRNADTASTPYMLFSRRQAVAALMALAVGGWAGTQEPVAASASCPLCGCAVNHCDKGVPAHLKCPRATDAQKEAIRRRKARLMDATSYVVQAGASINACNETVVEFAQQLGYDTGFPRLDQIYARLPPFTADRMREYLGSPDAQRLGWNEITPEEALQYADVGQFVVGAIHSADIQGIYGPLPEKQAHGHVFAVIPGDYSSAANAATPAWQKMEVLDSVLGSSAGVARRKASEAIRKAAQPKVKFYAFTHSEGA